jgi:hypothetical protein
MGVSTLFKWRRQRLAEKASVAAEEHLRPWAEAAGFEVLDRFDLDAGDVAQLSFEIALPGDSKRTVGVALRRRHARGELYLFDSVSPAGGRGTTAVMTTPAVLRPGGAGYVPGMPEDAVLSLTPGRITAHTDAELTPASAEELVNALSRYEASLEGIPGAAR